MFTTFGRTAGHALVSLSSLILLLSMPAHATHFRSGSLRWSVPDPIGAPLTVRFEVTTSWRSDYIGSQTLNYGDGQMSPDTVGTAIGTGIDATGLSFTVTRATFTHTYAAQGQYLAFFTSCCRLSNLVNAGDNTHRVEARVALNGAHVGSPVILGAPVVDLQTGGIRTFLIPAIDVDGDPVLCRFGTPAESGITTSPPVASGGATATIAPSSSPPGCLVTWNLSNAVSGQQYAFNVAATSAHGPLTASAVTDFIVSLSSAPPPVCSGPTVLEVGGTAATARFEGSGVPGTRTLEVLDNRVGTLTPGAGASGPSPLATNFSWTASATDVGWHTLQLRFRDSGNRGAPCGLLLHVARAVCGDGILGAGEPCDRELLAGPCPAGYAGTPLCRNDSANPNADGSCTLAPVPEGCLDVNECLTANGGCDLNATCANTLGSRTCACNPGWSGDGLTCSDVDECLTANGGCDANAACANTAGGRTCTCAPGWVGDGVTCAEVDECLTANGGCDANATCANTVGSRTCACNQGWSGDGLTCTDVNECQIANGGCDANAACANTAGGRTCTCAAGWVGDGVTCADADECLTANGGCDANATCTNTVGSRTCACNAGFAGDGATCADLDECATDNGGCGFHASCTNVPGGRTCTCESGWSGDGRNCSDVDECATANGGCAAQATCTNTAGSRTCTCLPGYAGDGTSCADVDECAVDNGGCDAQATCTNSVGSRACACNAGWSGDGLSCVPGCGDAMINGAEGCDDGALENGDGCSASCAVEKGFACEGAPSRCTPVATGCGCGATPASSAWLLLGLLGVALRRRRTVTD